MAQQFDSPIPSIRRGLFNSLSIPNFRIYICGHFLSMVGVWMQTVALSWLVWKLTGSARWLGLIGFASWFLTFIFGLVGGVIVDKIYRRNLIVITQALCMLQAIMLTILTLTGLINPYFILGLVLFVGAIYAFDFPARQSFITDLVGKENVDNAVGLSASAVHVARVLGPVAAGFIVVYWGEGACFAVNAASYLAFILAIFMLNTSKFNHQPIHDLPMYSAIKEGLKMAWGNRRLRNPLILLASMSFFCMPYYILVPIFADKVYMGGSRHYGFMMAASAVGALMGSFIMARSLNPQRTKIKIGVASLGLAISVICFSWTVKFWMGLIFMTLIGLFALVALASINAWLQRETPDELRGRIMSIYTIMFFGLLPFGSFAAGFLAEHFGAPLTLSVGGTMGAISSLCFIFGPKSKVPPLPALSPVEGKKGVRGSLQRKKL